jgi:predicted oxidoreductase
MNIKLSAEGPELSRIVYGMWRLKDDPKGVTPQRILTKINTAIEHGITSFDHADIYGDYCCEELFGSALSDAPTLRDSLQIITKCGIKLVSQHRPDHAIKHYDTGREHILSSVERSLKSLRTDRIDLLLIHRPDPLLDVDEVADAFVALRTEGKVLHFGVSNFSVPQMELLASRLPFPLVTNQVECSVMHMAPLADGTLDYCQRLRISPMAWSPLGGGSLFSSNAIREQRIREVLELISRSHEAAPDQIAIAWLLRHPAKIVPVIGTNDTERMIRLSKAHTINLSRSEWFQIWTASAGHPVP